MAENNNIILTSGLEETFRALKSKDPLKVQKSDIPTHPDYKRVPRHNYGPTTSVSTGDWGNGNAGMTKTASGGSGIIYGQPQFFSPVHTPINWQIPSKRIEQYQWCTVRGTEVLMGNGLCKEIQDVEVGEEVITHRGNIKKVMELGKRFVEEDIVSFRFSGINSALNITKNHEIFVIKRKKIKSILKSHKSKERYLHECLKLLTEKELLDVAEWIPSGKIEKGDYVLTPKINLKGNNNLGDYDSSLNKDLMFVLGLYVAEGCFAWYKYKDVKRPKGIRFCLNKNEKEIIESLRKSIKNICGKEINVYNNGEGDSYDIHVYDKELSSFIYSKVFGTANEKNIDESILNLDCDLLNDFMTGYISGDGHVNKNNSYIDCVTSSKALSENLSYIAMRLNVPFRRYYYESNDKKWNGYHILFDGGVCSKKGITKIGKDISKDFPMSKGVIPTSVGLFRRVDSVCDEYYEGFVYNIEVEEDKSYVVNFVGAHNSRFFYENEPKVASSIDFYCFDPETNILMSDGKQKRISSIVVGDLIRSHDGSINKVEKVNVRNTTNEKMLKIKVAGIGGVYNSKLKVTHGHKILTDKDGDIKFVSAEELMVGDYLLTPGGYGERNKNIISDDMSWLIGVYAAEGCAIPYNHVTKTGVDRRDHKGVYFTISIEENDLRDLIISKVKSIYGSPTIQINYDEPHGRMTIKVYGQNIADDLIGASPGTAKSRSKRFSSWVMKLSTSNLINILAGFLSGDGCYNSKNGFQGVGNSKLLMEQIANICDMIGVEYSYTSQRILNKNEKERISYNVRISRRACNFLIGLNNKMTSIDEVNENMSNNIPYFVKDNYIYRKIYSIEEYIYDGNLYDLSIENSHSYVANRIAVHNSDFPMSDFDHECKNRDVKRHFDKLKDRIEIPKWCRLISHEVHLLGDCFPFVEIDCPICGGSGKVGDEICEHEGGTIRRLVILNPDYVEVHAPSINPEPMIALRPDEELINMVQRRVPGYEKLSPEVVKLISSGQPIRLDNRNVSHLKYGECGYQKFGVGMVRRLFPILSYKTKLMVAQWIVAERLIVPVKIVKVGSDERPAGPADIADVQAQLQQTANDPNLTIVTHHAFDLDFVGAAGRVLTLSNEFEFINQEILDGMMINNALLNGEGPNFTHCEKTRLLTNNGLKYCDEFDIDKDLVATFNLHTKSLEYQKATKKFEYKWDSVNGDDPPMKRFLTNRIDMLVTPNHRMLCAERKLTTRPCEGGQKVNGQQEGYGEWDCVRAYDVKKRSKFRSCVDNWKETTLDREEYFGISTKDFLTIVGWYASEGYRNKWVRKDGSESISKVSFSQSEHANKEVYDKMCDLLSRNNIYHMTNKCKNVFYIRKSDNFDLVEYLANNCGGYANTKCIPYDIKNMSKSNLRVLLDALVEGDGSERPATKKKTTKKKYYSYTTVSKQLRDDVIEILFKLGYSPRFNTIIFDSDNLQTQYTISWTDTETGKFPVLDSRRWDNKLKKCSTKSENVITDEDYIGKVWCVEVPNHFIITERNGLFGIHGNSSAAVGIEAMIQRLTTFRNEIARWIEKNLYLPESIRQGFVEVDPETGEEEYIVPRIKWHSMHLRDQQQYRTFILQLYEKGLLSAQTVLESFDLDPDQEIERKRYDSLQLMAVGQDQAGGGGFGGMPPMGDIGGMGDMGGGEPPISAGGDMGDMGGGEPAAPVGGGVGGPMPKMTNIVAEVANPDEFGGKVLKKKTRDKIKSEQQKIYNKQETHGVRATQDSQGQMRDEKGRIIFTKAERDLIPKLLQAQRDGLLTEKIYPQYRVQVGNQEYSLDFGIPSLKIGIEADGEMFHSSKDQIARDKSRDMKLQQQGWTILRFTDSEIDKQGAQITRTVVKEVMRKKMWMEKNNVPQNDLQK